MNLGENKMKNGKKVKCILKGEKYEKNNFRRFNI